MNKVFLIGRITREPEIKYTQTGVAVVSFILAVDRDYKDEQGNIPSDFISCNAWRNQAEFIANYIKKGYLMAISGSIQTRSYTAQSGEFKVITEVLVDQVKNLTPKENNQTPPDKNVRTNGQPTSFPVDENCLF